MGRTKPPVGGDARVLIDELVGERKLLARAQARCADLMAAFADTRQEMDRKRISAMKTQGFDPRYRAGEFAANEVSMACSTSKFAAQRVIAMTRRVRAETPDAWDAFRAGDIDQDKVERINRALRRLQLDTSKALLNAWVVDVAVCKSPEILGRWLNQFILETEKDLQDERLRRSQEERYVSVRPDVDGMSFPNAELSAVDANAIDQVLNALAGIAEPGDTRTVQQRRADAMVDVLLGRVTNGCHLVWDTNTDADDHLDDPNDEPAGNQHDNENRDDTDHCDQGDQGDHDQRDQDGERETVNVGQLHNEKCSGTLSENVNANTWAANAAAWDPDAWDADDWDQPASAFRPDPHTYPAEPNLDSDPDAHPSITGSRSGTYPTGTARVTPCPGGGQSRPSAVTIGIVVTAQSLFGFSNTPGQLMDRSASIPAHRIRELAQQPGTLFHRLLTDDQGNLLDVTELGRFPSRKLAIAVKFRDGTCTGPTCTVSATRTDIDHITPVPEGLTTAANLNNTCRNEHRAKTHAGHQSARTGPHTTTWTTPTGHTYITADQTFLIEQWPTDEAKHQE